MTALKPTNRRLRSSHKRSLSDFRLDRMVTGGMAWNSGEEL
jgi:hypothetical protein